MYTAIAIFVVIIVFIFGPMGSIWAVNTLFDLNIPVNLATWAASLWLSTGLFHTGSSKGSK